LISTGLADCCQVSGDSTELLQGGFEVFDDFLGKDVGIGTISGALKAFNDSNGLNALSGSNRRFLSRRMLPQSDSSRLSVPEPEEVEAGLVAVDEFIMIVTMTTNVDRKYLRERIKPCNLGGFYSRRNQFNYTANGLCVSRRSSGAREWQRSSCRSARRAG
jgi:hypothetical protein